MRGFAVLLALGLTACATRPAEPIIGSVEVKVPVAVQCPDRRAPQPAYPDTPDALAAAPDLFERVKLLLAGRLLRDERLKEDEGQVRACAKEDVN
jgi:hypothetical protein